MRFLIAQSGGPTAVINASLAGAIKRAKENGHEIFGSLYGIEGVLNSKIVQLKFSDKKLEEISRMPGAFLGSCRHKLPNDPGNEEYDIIFKKFEENKIDAFLYIGGNDSMDAVSKIYREAVRRHFPLVVNGIPKTIDNDLVETDHCPGFASSAKFLNTLASEFVVDSISYSSYPICVIEAMGRDTGWLAASLKYVETLVDGLKVLTYIPEKPISEKEMLDEVLAYKDQPLLVSVSEGIKNEKGEYFHATNKFDAFGHPKLGGAGEYVSELLQKIKKVKFINPSFAQRAASHCVSELDFEEAKMVGSRSVDISEQGKTGLFMAIERTETDYTSDVKPVDIEKVANKIKYVPDSFVEENSSSLLEYLSPLLKDLKPFPSLSWRDEVQ
jgi:6-phosphofructokinase